VAAILRTELDHRPRANGESNMARITIIIGSILIALGFIGYLGSGPKAANADGTENAAAADEKPKRSITALIPTFVGAVLLICGFVALDEKKRMHAMHGAVLVGLLGSLAGAGRGAMGLVKMMKGDEVNGRSLIFVWLMAVICGVYVWLCIQSFIQARKRRQAEEGLSG